LRSGTVSINWGTYILNTTDSGNSSSLAQTPLNSPTVFNFFFPGYKFPGPLTTAGLTTPEFQLTSDTTVMFQMNFMEGGLLNNTSNTNGLSSFNGGGGAIVMDLGPWMPTASNIGNLISALNTRLCAGQLSTAASNQVYTYTATIGATTPALLRDRTRAVAHLLLCSPDFVIQR
jgi:hypothetical protein